MPKKSLEEIFGSERRSLDEIFSQPETAQMSDEKSSTLRQIGGAITALDRGKNLGFGKKLGAAIYAAGSYPVDRAAELLGVQNTPSFSDRYNEVFQDAKNMYNEFTGAHPVADVATEIAGAIKGAPAKATSYALTKAAQATQNASKLKRVLSNVAALGLSGSGVSVGTQAGDENNIYDYLTNPQSAIDAGLGAGINIAVPVAGKISKTGLNLGSKALGMTTGSGEGVISRSFDAGKRKSKVFLDNLRGKVSQEQIVGQAKQSLRDMVDANQDLYKSNMAKAFDDTRRLDLKNVVQNIKDVINQETLSGSLPLSGDEKAVIEKSSDFIKPALKERSLQTTKGLDKIRQKIYDITTQPGTNAHRIKKSIENSIKDTISEQRPEYRKALQTYAQNKSEIDEIARTFSLKDNNAVDTAMRKLQSVGRNNVQTNYGYRNSLMDNLDFGGNLQDAIAGQSLRSWMPRGAAGRIIGTANLATAYAKDPITTAGYALVSSPRVVGESAYSLGRLVDALEKMGVLSKNINVSGLQKRKNE